jgi:hypothetical protein
MDTADVDMERQAPPLPISPRSDQPDHDMTDSTPFEPTWQPEEVSQPLEPDSAPQLEQPSDIPMDLTLVTGTRSGPAAKRPLSLSPRSPAPISTSNRFTILQEDDLELSVEENVVPRLVLEDTLHPRVKTKAKKQKPNKSKHAHLERARKTMKDNPKGFNLAMCKQTLLSEPHVVAHSIYSHQGDTRLFEALAATRAVERAMAAKKAQGESENPRNHVQFFVSNDPQELLSALDKDEDLSRVRWALGVMDLFFTNRAPDLYSNQEALSSLLEGAVSRWEPSDTLTDCALWILVTQLQNALSAMSLPQPVQRALTLLVTIAQKYPIAALCDPTYFSLKSSCPWATIAPSM